MEWEFELMTSDSNIMFNHHLSEKFKLIKKNEFNHLIYVLTSKIRCVWWQSNKHLSWEDRRVKQCRWTCMINFAIKQMRLHAQRERAWSMTRQESKMRNVICIFKCTLFDKTIKIIIESNCHVKINRECALENPMIIFINCHVNECALENTCDISLSK